MNKWFAYILVTILASTQALAQKNNDSVRTLFDQNAHVTGFGGLGVQITTANNQPATFVGGFGGIILDKWFTIGGGGYGIATENAFDYQDTTYYLHGGYGSFLLGFRLQPYRLVHVNFPIQFGVGGVVLEKEQLESTNSAEDQRNQNIDTDSGVFFVISPGLEIEFNITHFFRIGIGGSYRYVSGGAMEKIDINDLSGVSYNLTFKFGKY